MTELLRAILIPQKPLAGIAALTLLLAMLSATEPMAVAAQAHPKTAQNRTTSASTEATAPVSLRYFSPDAYQVDVDVLHQRTRTTISRPMHYRDDSDMFYLDLPQGLFRKNDPLTLTFHPRNQFNAPLPPYTVTYRVGQTPEYFADSTVNQSPLRVRALQKNRSTSPAVQVYLPPASKTEPALIKKDEILAARLHRPGASLMSFHSLRPVPKQPDWYELQVPAFWFGQGEAVVVDLFASQQLAKLSNTPPPNGEPSDMRTLYSFTYKTLDNTTVNESAHPDQQLSQ
ncbi:MAG: hypothetical protein KC476_01540 [Cyanobacteria bacterium HKST-UBA06]|nr:hypothetical protein [Cyanobacteria bacterium HKST-UBA06]